MMVTPFLFSGAIPVSVLTAPVFSGRQLLWSGREVKREFPRNFLGTPRRYLAFSEAVNAFPPRNG
jgi:hypothetical protein